jgi:hypothetical protein
MWVGDVVVRIHHGEFGALNLVLGNYQLGTGQKIFNVYPVNHGNVSFLQSFYSRFYYKLEINDLPVMPAHWDLLWKVPGFGGVMTPPNPGVHHGHSQRTIMPYLFYSYIMDIAPLGFTLETLAAPTGTAQS